MDQFVNTLDADKFRSTNYIWNSLKLNDPWSVGYVTYLIEQRLFSKKEDWEQYYYQTGIERKRKISEIDNIALQNQLEDHTLILNLPNIIKEMDNNIRQINYYSGRTTEDLAAKGRTMYDVIDKRGNTKDLTLDECIECIRYRVICETWNGVVLRENNTVSALKKIYKELILKSTSADFDHRFAVDYEILRGSELIAGLQIKPQSYRGHSPFIRNARQANEKKNKEYQEATGCPVIYVYSKQDGTIINKEVLSIINSLIK